MSILTIPQSKPFANEHASRLISPKELEQRAGFQHVRRTHGSGKGKVQGILIPNTIDIIWYVFKDGAVIAQTLRFPIEHWTSDEALKWLKTNKIKYLSFEKATNGKADLQPSFKNFEFKVGDIAPEGIVSIYVNGFGNVDSDNDISEPGSFDKTIRENFKRIKHLKDHDRTICLGIPIEIKSDNFGLLVRSKMNLQKQIVKDVFEDYKFMAENERTLEHSIGYRVIKAYWEDPEKPYNSVRHITEYKLLEYSTLSFLGANENTPCVGIKGDMSVLQDDIKLLNDMLKGQYSDEKLQQIETKIKDIQTGITEMKSLTAEQPPEGTEIVVEPNMLFEKSIDYNYLIKNLKL